MWRRVLTLAAGLGLPLVAFLVPLQALAHGAAHEELRVEKLDASDARSVPARALTPHDLDRLPPAVREAFGRALLRGSASVPLDEAAARALAKLDLASGLAVVLDGSVLLLHIVENTMTVGEWVTQQVSEAACWLAARTGGGCG